MSRRYIYFWRNQQGTWRVPAGKKYWHRFNWRCFRVLGVLNQKHKNRFWRGNWTGQRQKATYQGPDTCFCLATKYKSGHGGQNKKNMARTKLTVCRTRRLPEWLTHERPKPHQQGKQIYPFKIKLTLPR